MTRRRLLKTLGGTAVVSSLTGCLGVIDGGGGSAGYGSALTAKDGFDQARETATDWNEEAALRGLFTVERPSEDAVAALGEGLPPEFMDPGVVDDTVGDGLAPAWNYNFEGQSASEHIVVTVHADGTAETNEFDQSFSGSPFEDWTIDSQTAFQTAAEHEAFADVLDHEAGTITATLFYSGLATLWRIDATNPDVDGRIGVEVDATSGESYQYSY